MNVPFFRHVAWYLVVAMFIIGIAPKVDAGLSPSELIAAQFDRARDSSNVQQVIENKMVSERLAQLGFTQEEVNSRLSQLSDQQLHKLAVNLDDIKTGGDGLGIIIALLVIAILVVILIQLTGHKVIVK
ncbi:MAG: hypothetical protein EHM54_08080 [Nitrospiraceae bacterium]|jgi:hypothetical protein|nr:MAG: hypothetical protein EHM54_08080 [Nitrospiraceae bacterium]